MMARITLPDADPERLTPEQRRVLDAIVGGPRGRIQGPLRAALHNAELADRWQALGALLRYRTSLSPRVSEIAILVTGRACASPLEWHVHRLEAERLGIAPAVLDALLAGTEPPGLDPAEAAAHQVAVELNRHRSVSGATYARGLACFGQRGMVELVALVGYYTLVAMTLNAHEIPLPDGAEPAFPMPQQAGLA